MAGWALGLALLPCCGLNWLVAVGLAIAVLVRSRDGRDHGKGLAIAALIIAPLWVVVSIVAGLVSGYLDARDDTERDAAGHVVARDDLSTLRLRAGDCFDNPAFFGGDDEESVTVTGVPCAEPHQFEVYLAVPLTDGDYPGEDAVIEVAERQCDAEFRGFVGVPRARSQLQVAYYYPTATSWRLFDDRSIVCFLGVPHQTTTGSLAHSRR